MTLTQFKKQQLALNLNTFVAEEQKQVISLILWNNMLKFWLIWRISAALFSLLLFSYFKIFTISALRNRPTCTMRDRIIYAILSVAIPILKAI